MVNSMTGFGRSEKSESGYKLTVEMKAVNHRYLDLSVKIPRKLSAFEGELRSLLKERIQRGKVDVFVSLQEEGKQSFQLQYNSQIAGEYLKNLRIMADEYGLKSDIDAVTLSKYPEVFTQAEMSEDEDFLGELLMGTLVVAIDNFNSARALEGENLRKDIMDKLDKMEGYVDRIDERAPQIVAEYKAKLESKVKELLADNAIDSSRIVAEVTIYADKICVDEETVRLRSHVEAMRKALGESDSVGRKLDFIAQEMNRESNTILSKMSNVTVTDIAIGLKTEIEKIREQIQNIE